MKSCLYECEIWHERKLPRLHAFTVRHFMFYLALSELSSKAVNSRLLGINRLNIFSFFEKDYLPDSSKQASSLTDRVRRAAKRLGIRDYISRINLLTNVRIFGYVFNPVSFYFCFGAEDRLLCCICEVGNTFGEKKVFLVEPDSNGLLRRRQKKFFYVSPFTELDQEFDFSIPVPGDGVSIRIDTLADETPIVRASLTGKRTALTDANLISMLLRYSWATAKVIALIHVHALLLCIKQVPFHRKEEKEEMQLDILNPRAQSRATPALSIKVKENENVN